MCLTTKRLYVPYYYTSYALKKQAIFHIYAKKSPSSKEHLHSNDEWDYPLQLFSFRSTRISR